MTDLIKGLFLFYRSCQGSSKNISSVSPVRISFSDSVVACLLKGTSDWHIDIDNERYIAMIFIDLKKAFDTVDYQILFD